MAFTHLHLHTEYSLLDGACRINSLFKRAQELGQTAVAVTDHGAMYGVVDFYKEAKKEGLKPIIGCEVYVAARSRHDKQHTLDSDRSHLILLCENNEGYQNLMAMVSEAWSSGFYTKPRVDRELLKKHHKGLIALSACLAGEVPKMLLRGDYEEAKNIALWYADVFGKDNYFLEIQNHGLEEQLQINPLLIQLSQDTGIPLVATNDTHYVNKDDARIQQILICIQTNHILGESTGFEFTTEEFYLKSESEMLELFSDCPDAVSRSDDIAARCNVDIEFGVIKLPHFDVPGQKDNYAWFRALCYDGFARRYGNDVPQEYRDRLEYELHVIHTMGYVDYYLIVHDFIRRAKEMGIPVGPGRGSGAGSIAAYVIGITGIDPMKYNLLFERFLNPERVSMPDFDIDFCYERRSQVIDYVVNKYGEDHVAQIITFGTMAARAAIRDVGRALGLPYSTVDIVAKQIPNEIGITIAAALEKSDEFRRQYEGSPEIKDLIDTAAKMEGMPRHASTHAAGVVITRDPVHTYVPLAKNDEAIVTQFAMTTIEELGLLKMDFLGLRTLTVIDGASKMIAVNKPDFDIENIPLDDPDVYAMLSQGLTEGVFQFESAGMRNVLMGLIPVSLEDLIAVISLYRPGPMESIPAYIENRHHPERIRYKTPALSKILDVTNGCIVYQEQVMEIFRELAGYSYGQADIIRRAMSKKKHEVMNKERERFIHGTIDEKTGKVLCDGAVRRGVSEQAAAKIYEEMESFASYAFNKSHAAAYALIAYQTAWLKNKYPCEFMAALLSSVIDNTNKISTYIAECRRLGITVLPPSVNESAESFTVSNSKIRFGLLAVKNLGRGFIQEILTERNNNGLFTSFFSFCKRMYGKDFNRRAVEGLIKCGALDGLQANRRQMLQVLPVFISNLDCVKRNNVEGQLGLFEMVPECGEGPEPELQPLDELPHGEILALEKETVGIYLSGHPMAAYENRVRTMNSAKTSELLESAADPLSAKYADNERIMLIGIISSVKRKISKNNTTMAFITVEDMHGSIEVIIFSKIYSEYVLLLCEGRIVKIYGRLSLREDEDAKVVCELMEPLSFEDLPDGDNASEISLQNPVKTNRPKSSASCLFLRFPCESSSKRQAAEKILSLFEGATPVRYYYCDTQKYVFRSKEQGADINPIMLEELRRLLGDDNVVFRK